MRIVLADDHALFRDGVSSLLQAWGHEVVGRASNGVEAVDLVLRLEPDLVLMDVRMPGKTGVEATREIGCPCWSYCRSIVTPEGFTIRVGSLPGPYSSW